MLFRSLCSNIANLLQSANAITTNAKGKVILFIDGLETLNDKSENTSGRKNVAGLDWLPATLASGVVLVVSTHQGSKWDKFFHSR